MLNAECFICTDGLKIHYVISSAFKGQSGALVDLDILILVAYYFHTKISRMIFIFQYYMYYLYNFCFNTGTFHSLISFLLGTGCTKGHHRHSAKTQNREDVCRILPLLAYQPCTILSHLNNNIANMVLGHLFIVKDLGVTFDSSLTFTVHIIDVLQLHSLFANVSSSML